MNRTNLILVTGTAAALIAACSSSKATSSTSAPPSTSPASTPSSTSPAAGPTSAPQSSVAAPTSPAKSSPPAGLVLSGSWQGRYSGAYSGTFVLRWAQSASKLTGTINLSTAPGAVPINGTVTGGKIQFGTVGSQAITYTGSVTGNSMSGHYDVAGGAGGSGTWSATRR